jgi:predicted nucleotidyltransferase
MAQPSEQILSTVGAILRAALPDAWATYVYGSFARGDEGPDSDIDLAVLLPPGQTIPDLFGLMAELSTRVGREVDLVDLRRVGLDLIREILRDGRQLSVQRPDETLAWEAEKMTDYADFNPRRRELLDMYLREPLIRHA